MPVNLAFELVDTTFVVIHAKEPPSDAEWGPYLELSTDRPAERQNLIFTDGGAPTQAQRQALTRKLGGATLRAAVMSDAASVRFIASAMSLFNPGLKTFSTSALDEALAFLGAAGRKRNLLEATERVLARLGPDRNAAAARVLAASRRK